MRKYWPCWIQFWLNTLLQTTYSLLFSLFACSPTLRVSEVHRLVNKHHGPMIRFTRLAVLFIRVSLIFRAASVASLDLNWIQTSLQLNEHFTNAATTLNALFSFALETYCMIYVFAVASIFTSSTDLALGPVWELYCELICFWLPNIVWFQRISHQT